MEKSLLLRPTLRLTFVVQRPIILRYQSYLEVNHRAGKNGAPSVAGSIKWSIQSVPYYVCVCVCVCERERERIIATRIKNSNYS